MSWGDTPRPKMCNYRGRQCGTEIIWDNAVGYFKNTHNGERHRCPNYNSGDGGSSYSKPNQQQVSRSSSDLTNYESDSQSQDTNSAILVALNEINETHVKFGESMTKLEKAIKDLTKNVSDSIEIARRLYPNNEDMEKIESITEYETDRVDDKLGNED